MREVTTTACPCTETAVRPSLVEPLTQPPKRAPPAEARSCGALVSHVFRKYKVPPEDDSRTDSGSLVCIEPIFSTVNELRSIKLNQLECQRARIGPSESLPIAMLSIPPLIGPARLRSRSSVPGSDAQRSSDQGMRSQACSPRLDQCLCGRERDRLDEIAGIHVKDDELLACT